MLNEVIKRHILNQVSEKIKGKSLAEARAVVIGEVYTRKQILSQTLQQEERLNDEIAELEKFDVEAEIEKSVT